MLDSEFKWFLWRKKNQIFSALNITAAHLWFVICLTNTLSNRIHFDGLKT